MKKLIVFSVAACMLCASIAVFAQRGTGPDGRPAKSARDTVCANARNPWTNASRAVI